MGLSRLPLGKVAPKKLTKYILWDDPLSIFQHNHMVYTPPYLEIVFGDQDLSTLLALARTTSISNMWWHRGCLAGHTHTQLCLKIGYPKIRHNHPIVSLKSHFGIYSIFRPTHIQVGILDCFGFFWIVSGLEEHFWRLGLLIRAKALLGDPVLPRLDDSSIETQVRNCIYIYTYLIYNDMIY